MGKQLEKALTLHRAGAVADAERLYAGLFRRDARDAEAAYLLGVARLGLDRNEDAVAPLERAVRLRPNHLESLRALAEARDRTGRAGAAIAAYRRACALAPDDPRLHLNLSALCLALGDTAAALSAADRAAALAPDLADAWLNGALALKGLGRFEDARARFERALVSAPQDARIPFNLGNMLAQRGGPAGAKPWLEQALRLAPGLIDAHLMLAYVRRELADTDGALATLDTVLTRHPDHPTARVWRCFLGLPVVYRDAQEVAERRRRYEGELNGLAQEVSRRPAAFLPGFASARPFLLAYQGEDDLALQTTYGTLLSEVVQAAVQPPKLKAPNREKHRIGIVSGYFRHHSVWKIPTRGWLELDPTRFELVCYHTGADRDEQTRAAAERADRFVQGPKGLTDWVTTIADDACDALLYPEIGMDPMAIQLAALRLAPVQCNGLGHPVTSGLASMDHALSSAFMEPPDGHEHYGEALVRLPNLSIFYDYLAPPPAAADRADFGFDLGSFIFWCGQSLFKYQPAFDWTFAAIAAKVPRVRFLFIAFQGGAPATEVFARRLERAFAALGLDWARHCRILPRLSPGAFAATSGACDAILDSMGWAGFNSTMESLAYDLPLVTYEGPFMRGRHGAAILRRLDLSDLIATSPDAFVQLAIRLATDAEYHARCKDEVGTRKHVLFRDMAAVTALADFLDSAIAGARALRDGAPAPS